MTGVKLHLFFFADHMHCLPQRQRLLWLLVSEHFRRAGHAAVQHHFFEGSWRSKGRGALLQLFEDTDPSCVLTDFGRGMPNLGVEDIQMDASYVFHSVRSGAFVHWLRCNDMNVVDFEGLKTDGPRISCQLLELRSPQEPPVPAFVGRLPWPKEKTEVIVAEERPEVGVATSLRLTVGLVALRNLSPSDQEGSVMGLCGVFCICLACMETTPLASRGISEKMEPLPPELKMQVFVNKLQNCLLQSLLTAQAARPREFDVTLADIFDGRLLHFLTLKTLVGRAKLIRAQHEWMVQHG